MKRFGLALLLLAALGCRTGRSKRVPAPAPAPPEPVAAATPEAQLAEVRLELDRKQKDLAQVDADLAKIEAERADLGTKDASGTKTERLAELGRLEDDAKLRKTALESDVAALRDKERTLAGTPKTGAEALDEALAAADRQEQEAEAERRRKIEEQAAADEKRKVEEAALAKADEDARRAKEKLPSAGIAPAAPPFEERYAAVILKLMAELQRFKRW
jgi:colicin import membrane protein